MENRSITVVTVPLTEWNETKEMVKSIFEKLDSLHLPDQKEFLTSNEVCELLKIGRTTLQRHIYNGVLEVHRTNPRGKMYFKYSSIKALLNTGELPD